MEHFKAGSRASRKGSPDWFTGDVTLEPIVEAPAPATVSANRVTFEPGARTAWHTHPLGQTLYVSEGIGRVQTWGEPVREIRPGDTVWIPPGEKHWHGAAPDTAMTHIAFQEGIDGVAVVWLEQVSDADYSATPA
ncbi:MAG: hypothetical protein RLZ98_809 [Pseudomonadota bacterium]|jgi:quercetin dioxygenase-like cupin family protein